MSKRLNVPYASQLAPDAMKYNNDCGAASADMLIEYFSGLKVTPDELYEKITKTDRYLYANELKTLLQGYHIPSFWKEGLGLSDLKAAIDAGRPMTVLVNYGPLVDAGVTEKTNFRGGHFMNVIGYGNGQVIVHDPYQLDGGAGLVLDERLFMNSWQSCHYQNNPNGGAVIPMISRDGDNIVGSGLVHYGGSLNVRSGPGFGYPIIGGIPNNSRVELIDVQGEWGKVFPGCWISVNPMWVYFTQKGNELSRVYTIDVSKWQEPIRIPWELLLTHGFLLGIPKASMGGGYDKYCDAHATLIKSAGAELGLYHWVDPIQDWKRQAGFFIDMILKHKPKIICFDIEQWWADWDKWEAYQYEHKIPVGQVPRLTEADLVIASQAIITEVLSHVDYPLERVEVYTARWFTSLYPGLVPMIKNGGYQLWNASYVGSKERYYDWDEFHALSDTWKPLLPEDMPECNLWQYASMPKLKSCPIRLDYNRYHGNQEQFRQWLDDGEEPVEDTLLEKYNGILKDIHTIRDSTQDAEQLLKQFWSEVQR